jgi:formylglycine-generating enzyme required for sulfatase activity
MQVPGYTIIRELGKGGMATVYLAIQDRLNRQVALKVMEPISGAIEDFTQRFAKEGQIIAQFQHPQITTIYDFNSYDGIHYFSMEYLPGGTLAERIPQGLPLERVLEIVTKVAEALAYAHERGIIHRDLKPQNILFRQDGTPVLSDFGIAKVISASPETTQLTQLGTAIGSPRYMSPEQITSQPLDPRSDLYSLGLVLFEMLTGQQPYRADDVITLALKHCSEPAPPLPHELSGLQPVLDKLLAKRPDQRFDSAKAVIRAVERIDTRTLNRPSDDDETRIVAPAEAPPRARAGEPPAPKPPLHGRKGLTILIATLLVTAAAAGTYVVFFPHPQATAPEMVPIKGGCFEMGSPPSEPGREADERQHKVCVKDFQIGKYEVKVKDFRRFVQATGYQTLAERNLGPDADNGCWALDQSDTDKRWKYRSWANWQEPNKYHPTDDEDPVSCISWLDAEAYVAWLNQATGGHYRLPTEAEWEYAARAGTTTARFWGDGVDARACKYADVADAGHKWADSFPCDDGYEWVAPVGQYRPNAWGLYDILGNLSEWTCSPYDQAYDGAETKCMGKSPVVPISLRGGSWYTGAKLVRSAYRDRNYPDARYDFLGFRLAGD